MGSTMLVAFTFEAQAGREKELHDLLDDPGMARDVARWMGATRNTLFYAQGRVVRVLEFPEGVKPRPMGEIAREQPAFAALMKRVGELVKDGFDPAAPETVAAFNARAMMPLVLDVRP